MLKRLHIPKPLSLFILLCMLPGIKLAAQVKLTEENWTLPTWEVLEPENSPMFFKGEVYQGASKYIYPYAMNDLISNERETKDWKAIILENEYIKLCVTPEIGGKLYYAKDKTNDYNFIYKNDVVKPANIGMTGAWVSGGIEWCVLHHHRASTMLPVDYYLQDNDDGSKTIWIGETEPRQRMRWTIGITAFPGKSYFMAEVKILNPTPYTHSFLYWANVAAHTNKNYQVIFPPSVNQVTYHAKNSFANWPVSHEVFNGTDFTEGVDLSYWINSVRQNSYFAHNLQEDFMGGYDHGKETGTVHIGDHNIVKGAKLWEWGSGEAGQATEGRLTEDAGPYVEIMVGAFSDNQPDYSWIRPYEVKTFKQYWYPVKDIGGFKNANLNGAVNLEKRKKGELFMGYYSTAEIKNAKVVLKKNGQLIHEKTIEIAPDESYTETIKVQGDPDITEFHTELINLDNGEVLISYQPKKRKPAGELPPVVEKPGPPLEIETIEELYLTGNRILQFYNPTLEAMEYFQEALRRDPFDARTNVAVGKIQLEKGELQAARKSFSRAIKRLTKDYTRPYDCEALYLQGLTLKSMGLLDAAIDTLYRATWDYAYHSAAYMELAEISCIQEDYMKALTEVDRSLSTNTKNNSAQTLKSSILRKIGNPQMAKVIVEKILQNDPLDFRARNELILAEKQLNKNTAVKEQTDKLKTLMRNHVQNYLELAADYMKDGFYKEAEEVLVRFPGQHAMISYYRGFIADKKGNPEHAMALFEEGSAQSIDYVFPFRLESSDVLVKVQEYRPSDPKPAYYLGNLWFDKQPGKSMGYWKDAVNKNPGMAIAWRNLGWGYNYFKNDIPTAVDAYEHAVNLNDKEPIYYAELDVLYEKNNAPLSKRIDLFEGNHEVVKGRDDALVREMMVLNLANQPEKTLQYLDESVFHFREGNFRVSDITIDASILRAKQLHAEGKYEKALELLLSVRANHDNPNQAESLNGSRDEQICYFVGRTYENMGKKKRANDFYSLVANEGDSKPGLMLYYKGLCYLNVGEQKNAETCFKDLIDEGSRRMKEGEEIDFFAKFGEQESRNTQKSNAYLLIGLGNKGLGNNSAAKENLSKAMELSTSNLWAKIAYED